MIALLLAAVVTAAPACPSTRPADTASVTWVCIDGGWRPTSPTPGPAPAPAPVPAGEPFGPRFKVGKFYQRDTTSLFISGAGQLPDGAPVLFAICQTIGDGCFAVGYVRAIPANATSHDFTETP